MLKSNAIKDYDIWGNPTLTVETTSNPIRYSGEFYDSETGLYYLRARYYDPYIGRFTTEDSYWGEDDNPLSLNLYTYCMNDPIQYTDPTGHVPMFVPLIGIIEDVDEDDVDEWLADGCSIVTPESEFWGGVDNYTDVDVINTVDGMNSTITNHEGSSINTVNTGNNSNTTINNYGVIDTINSGKNSSLTLINYESGYINKIIGGNISDKDSLLGINVKNYGRINYIQTGVNSTNEVFDYIYGSGIGWLVTGDGNATYNNVANVRGQGTSYKISARDKENIDYFIVNLKKYIGQFGTLPQGKLGDVEKALNSYKHTQGQLEYFMKELRATGKLTVTKDKISGKYKVNNNPKTYYEIYYEQIMNTPNNSLYGINVPEEYGRFVFAAHKAGIKDQDIMGIEDWVNTNAPIWVATYDDRSVQGMKEAVSIILGFTPVDIYKDAADLIAGKDIVTGREANRVLLALCLISPEIFDKLLKGGLKQSDLFEAATAEVKWTNHGYKHFPSKNTNWNDVIRTTKSGPAKYKLGIDVEALERKVWFEGTKVTNGKNWKVMKLEDVIGASGGKETKYIRVEESGGTIHGHPITESEYKKLIK